MDDLEFGGANDEIRFNFTHSSFDEIAEGVERIRSVMLNLVKL